MTYEELAKLRHISKSSAERMVFRNRWRRQRGNDRIVRALVPLDSLPPDLSPDAAGDASPGVLAAFQDALAVLREQLDRATGAMQAAEARGEGERERADRAEAKSEALRRQVEELRAGQTLMTNMHANELGAVRDQLQTMRDAAESLHQAEADRKARGVLARLRAAWKGEG